jgi:hypothetical protein
MTAMSLALLKRRRAKETEFWGLLLSLAVILVWGASVSLGFVTGTKVLTFLGLVVAAAGLFKPSVGLMGVAMLSALDAFSRVYVFTGVLPWNTFNYFLLLALLFLARDLKRVVTLPAVAGAVLFAFLAVELLFSDEKLVGVQHLLGLAALFGLLVFAVRAAGQPEAWVWSAIVTGCLGAGGGLVYLRFESEIPEVNKNAWAYLPLTALALVAVAIGFVADRPKLRFVLLSLAAVNLCWVFLSASRGTFFVALLPALYVLGVVVRAVATGTGGPARAGGILVAIAATALAVSLVSGRAPASIERLAKLFDSERSIANRTSGRSDLARIGWSIFLHHPLGIGTGEFVARAANYGAKESLSVFHEGQRELQAHSAWVKTLAENGVPGTLLLAFFVASFAIAGWQRRAGLFGLGLLASLVLGFAFVSTEFQAKGIWLFAAAVIVMLAHARRTADDVPFPEALAPIPR